MQRLLQAHPRICGGEESHFFTLFAAPLETAAKMADSGRKRKIGPLCYVGQSEFEDMFRDVWNRIFRDLYDRHPESIIHLEKTPFHVLCLDQIQRIFPDAKVIFLARDSRAVASSLVHAGRGWGNYWAPNTYKDASIMWFRHVRAILDWQCRNPEHPFLQVRYEDALRDTPGELARILRLLFPDDKELLVEETLNSFEAGEAARKDPEGFSRLRGTAGWQEDLPLWGKLTTWRYTRKMMRELGYDITPFR